MGCVPRRVPRVPRPLRCSNQLIYEASPAENNSLACSCVPRRKRWWHGWPIWGKWFRYMNWGKEKNGCDLISFLLQLMYTIYLMHVISPFSRFTDYNLHLSKLQRSSIKFRLILAVKSRQCSGWRKRKERKWAKRPLCNNQSQKKKPVSYTEINPEFETPSTRRRL